MRLLPLCGLLLMVAAVPALAQTGAVVVGDAAGIDPGSLETLRRLTLHALQQEGVRTVDAPALGGVVPFNDELAAKVHAAGADRLFVLHPSRLGQKLIIELEERSGDGRQLVAAASLTAAQLEEADVIIPRLARAVVRREAADATAQLHTVTEAESTPDRKRPGEGHFVLGIPFGLNSNQSRGAFGLSLGWLYEVDQYRIEFAALGVAGPGGAAGLLGVSGTYLFLQSSWSPYATAGVGYMGIRRGDSSGGGAGLTAELGVEFLRLYHVHLLVGVEALLPAYRNADASYTPYFLLYPRIAF